MWMLAEFLRRSRDMPLADAIPEGFGLQGGPKDARAPEVVGRLSVLAMLTAIQVATITSKLGWHGIGLAAGIVSILCVLAWAMWVVGWVAPWRYSPYLALAGLLVLGLGGAFLTGVLTKATGISPVFTAIASMVISARWPPLRAAYVVGSFEVVLLLSAASQGWHQFVGAGLGYGSLFAGMYGLGVGRRSYILRAESAEKLVQETDRANHEQAHAAALAERSRIAREIHDVLAHSLAALTVQLEAADALLEAGGDQGVIKAHGYVQKSRRIAREGLVETRRAIAALREDSPPLPELLYALADAYRGDSGASAEVEIEGLPRLLQADAGLTLYRAVQESLTNVRKHAPGASVRIRLTFGDEELVLSVVNGAPTEPRSALADSGGGYGLAGLKERAELIGGSLEAGARKANEAGAGGSDGAGDGWHVTLRLPG